jgi:hypothetical protein
MAWIVGDSFDFYSPTGGTGGVALDLFNSGGGIWDTYDALAEWNIQTAQTRFGVGAALYNANCNTGAHHALGKSFSSAAVIYIALAFYVPAFAGTNYGLAFCLWDGNTVQCTVHLRLDGSILVYSGLFGAVLATYASAFPVMSWNHFQVRVALDPTAGGVCVRRNGNTTDDFAAAGLALAPSGTGQANRVTLYQGANTTPSPWYADDLVIFTGSAPAPDDWVGDLRAVQVMPDADTATRDFTPSPGTIAVCPGASAPKVGAVGANTVCSGQVMSAVAGTVTGLTVVTEGAYTGKFRLALYDATGGLGAPGTLLGQTAEQTDAPAGTIVAVPLVAPVAVAAGQLLYGALLVDSSFPVVTKYTGSDIAFTAAQTYALGFPAVFGIGLANENVNFPYITAAVVPFNSSMVSELREDGDTTYVSSAVPGATDLYAVAPLDSIPVTIVAVQTRGFARKNDSGLRSCQLQLVSGGTTVLSPATPLQTSYQCLSRVDVVDPNTGAAWTAAALGALQVGPTVTA